MSVTTYITIYGITGVKMHKVLDKAKLISSALNDKVLPKDFSEEGTFEEFMHHQMLRHLNDELDEDSDKGTDGYIFAFCNSHCDDNCSEQQLVQGFINYAKAVVYSDDYSRLLIYITSDLYEDYIWYVSKDYGVIKTKKCGDEWEKELGYIEGLYNIHDAENKFKKYKSVIKDYKPTDNVDEQHDRS